MLPKWTCAILGGLLLVSLLNPSPVCAAAAVADDPAGLAENSERSLDAGIELSEYDYEDHCLPVGKAEWSLLHQPDDPQILRQWINASLSFAEFKRQEREHMIAEFSGTSKESSELTYKLSVIEEPGDASLNETDYAKLISFVGENRVLRATARYEYGGKNLTREEVEFLLAHHGTENEKLKAWETWHQHLAPQAAEFAEVLQIAQKAAVANEKEDVASYWEMLTGEPDAYESYVYQQVSLKDLRMKLVEFVRKRLANKYNVEMANSSIPAHLLGSLTGNDWTHLALDVAPNPDLIFELRKKLWERKLMGRYLYKAASSLSKKFLGQTPESQFWTESNFKGECPSTLVNLCKLGKIRVSTCNEPSLSNYLSAHKNVAKVLAHQMSSKVPILNDANRYSVLEEAVAEFFSILAASPAWLKHVGLMDKSVGNEEATITSLTITALDVLPRLAYYANADNWRLQALSKNETDAKQLTTDWWKSRLQEEFISTKTSEPPTFLNDDYITSNKPYLSKVLGIVLAFQMYNYVMKTTDVRLEPFEKSSFNSGLIKLVQNNSDYWKDMLGKYMDVSSLSTDSMRDYFSELEYYLESYEESDTPYDANAKEVELEQLEKVYRKIANTPTTTTTTTTTTTSTTTTTTSPRPRAKPSSLSKDQSTTTTTTAKSPASRNGYLEEAYDDEDEEHRDKPKVNTSKAVWAVAAVLVATLTICIIAIFGRRRCARTPKNRRYV